MDYHIMLVELNLFCLRNTTYQKIFLIYCYHAVLEPKIKFYFKISVVKCNLMCVFCTLTIQDKLEENLI